MVWDFLGPGGHKITLLPSTVFKEQILKEDIFHGFDS